MLHGAKYLWKLPQPVNQAVLDLDFHIAFFIPSWYMFLHHGDSTTRDEPIATDLAPSSGMLLILRFSKDADKAIDRLLSLFRMAKKFSLAGIMTLTVLPQVQ